MTQRTESNPPSPVELATENTVTSIRQNALLFHREFQVLRTQHMDDKQFLRILALYFHNKSIADWCRDLQIADATDPADKPSHGGEG